MLNVTLCCERGFDNDLAQRMPSNNPFLTMPVRAQLLRATKHSLLGTLSIVLFNLADMWFIGRLGLDELAALGYVGPILLILISVLIGCELTASILLSEALGKSKQVEVRSTLVGVLSYGLTITLVLLLVGIFFSEWIVQALGAQTSILELANTYLQVWLYGYPALAVCLIGTSILRAGGKTKLAGYILLSATLSNTVLDPVFIFGVGDWVGWGMEGAAWASVLTRVVAAIFVIYYLNLHFALREYNFSKLASLYTLWKNIVGLASTITFNRLIIPCATAIATAYISQFGKASVAAFGVINVLQTLPIAFILALNGALIPFLRQNASAGNISRAAQSVRFSLFFIAVWAGAQAGLFFVLSDWIASHFTTEKNATTLLHFYYQYIPISMIGIGLFLVNNSVSYSFKQGPRVLKLNLIRVLFLYLPCIFVGGELGADKGVLVALGVANVGMGIVALISISQHFKKGCLRIARV
ncbi:MATE family efflux transporter [Alteromonas sp. a30]|uniref:MATE family efflux transporter n=1 Tax=Alteromonas sp. a30 TaxID=2730917 RepID=UPI0022832D20|nr:MATE family efflux transporter [Alteromonas sp. a30]MCY7295337.1 MATE family efflux transporter [Alteromonas sp. a30]